MEVCEVYVLLGDCVDIGCGDFVVVGVEVVEVGIV